MGWRYWNCSFAVFICIPGHFIESRKISIFKTGALKKAYKSAGAD
jgi:hypothetical protein